MMISDPILENSSGARTPHKFVRKTPVKVFIVNHEGDEPVEVDAIALEYECTVTGERRRWGCE